MKPTIRKEWSLLWRDYMWACRGYDVEGFGATPLKAWLAWRSSVKGHPELWNPHWRAQ